MRTTSHPFEGRGGIAKRNSLAREIGKRDGFACFLCGCALYGGKSHPQSRVVEHLEPWRLSPEKAYDANNLLLCCKRCHDTTCASIEAEHKGKPQAIRDAKLRSRGYDERGRPIW